MRSIICSSKWSQDADGYLVHEGRCHGCQLREGSRGGKKSNISVSHKRAMLWLSLDEYYLVPARDKDGSIMRYQTDSETHKKDDIIYDRLTPEECENHPDRTVRRDAQSGNFDVVQGALRHWSVSKSHMDTLAFEDSLLQKTCNCGGDIHTAIWECGNCQYELYDCARDEPLSAREETRYSLQEVECPKCGHFGMAHIIPECDLCENPEPQRLWDVVLGVQTIGSDEKKPELRVVSHEDLDTVPEHLFSLIPPNPKFLERVFMPDPLDLQADRFEISKDRAERAQETRSRRGYRDEEDDVGAEEGKGKKPATSRRNLTSFIRRGR